MGLAVAPLESSLNASVGFRPFMMVGLPVAGSLAPLLVVVHGSLSERHTATASTLPSKSDKVHSKIHHTCCFFLRDDGYPGGEGAKGNPLLDLLLKGDGHPGSGGRELQYHLLPLAFYCGWLGREHKFTARAWWVCFPHPPRAFE